MGCSQQHWYTPWPANTFMALLGSFRYRCGYEIKIRHYVCEQLFGLLLLRTDRPIIPDNPHLTAMLRLAQFQVAVELGSFEIAFAVADRVFEEFKLIPATQMRSELTCWRCRRCTENHGFRRTQLVGSKPSYPLTKFSMRQVAR